MTANHVTRLIKKYPNRRLYDTHASSYITLADVKQLVLDHEEFTVVDSKTDEDITRSILLQIILEEESGQVPIFSANALAHIIRFYGTAVQGVMCNYIVQNIQAFIDIHDRMAELSKVLYDVHIRPAAYTRSLSVTTTLCLSDTRYELQLYITKKTVLYRYPKSYGRAIQGLVRWAT